MTDVAETKYQLVIIGGGPAGLTAGIYAARSRVPTLLIDRGALGGQMINAELIENYPGFPQGVSGVDLASLMGEQAMKYGLELAITEVEGIEVDGLDKIVKTADGDYRAKAVIIAGGSEHSKLGVPGEEKLTGKGVSFCAMCDGAFFLDQKVAVIGGGNVALGDALYLTRFASKVIVVHRRDQLRATRILQEQALANHKIEFLWNTVVESINGDGDVKDLSLKNLKTEQKSTLAVSGVFVAVGLRPNSQHLEGVLRLAPGGVVPTSVTMETEMPGIFAAGDIRCDSPQQIITAAGDGATAAISAERYLSSL